jgi:hypothetical protein
MMVPLDKELFWHPYRHFMQKIGGADADYSGV